MGLERRRFAHRCGRKFYLRDRLGLQFPSNLCDQQLDDKIDMLRWALLSAIRVASHDLDDSILNLRVKTVDCLLNNAAGSSFLRGRLENLSTFIPSLLSWHVDDLLTVAIGSLYLQERLDRLAKSFPILWRWHVDDLLTAMIGSSSLWERLIHLTNCHPSLWNWPVHDLLHCAQFHKLFGAVFHGFVVSSLILRAGSVDDLLNGMTGNSFARNELDLLSNFLPSLRNWHVVAWLRCALLQALFGDALHDCQDDFHDFDD